MIVLFFYRETIEIGRYEKSSLAISATENYSTLSSEQIAKWVKQNCEGNKVSVLFGGKQAFCCSIRNSPKMRNNDQAVGFAVEEHLPVAAENMDAQVATPSSREPTATAIASEHDLADVVNAINKYVEVIFVGYTPLLALQAISKRTKSNKDYHLLLEARHEIDLLTIVNRSLSDWQWLPTNDQSNSLSKNPDWSFVRSVISLPVFAYGNNNADGHVGQTPPIDAEYAGSYQIAQKFACETVQKIVAGKQEADIDLPAVSGIGKRNLDSIKTWFYAGLSLLLIGFTSLFLIRTQQVERKIEELSKEIDSQYREAYPAGPETPLKKRVLNARLDAFQEAKDLCEQLQPSLPYKDYLKKVLSGFPNNTGAAINSFEMRPESLTIHGFVPDIDAADLDRRFSEAGFVAIANSRKQQSNGKRAFSYQLTLGVQEAQK